MLSQGRAHRALIFLPSQSGILKTAKFKCVIIP